MVTKRTIKRSTIQASGREKALEENDRRLGLYIVEVARATLEGRLPINQKGVLRALKANHRLNLPPEKSTAITKILKQEFRNKIWLNVSGHEVTLFSEDETLVDARAVRALFLARDFLNEDGAFILADWVSACENTINLAEDTCTEFLEDYIACNYANRPDNKGRVKLDIRAIGEDSFYLNQAAKAGLRKSIARTKLVKKQA